MYLINIDIWTQTLDLGHMNSLLQGKKQWNIHILSLIEHKHYSLMWSLSSDLDDLGIVVKSKKKYENSILYTARNRQHNF